MYNEKKRNLLPGKLMSVMLAVIITVALLPASAFADATQGWITWGTPAAEWTGADENGDDWYAAGDALAFNDTGDVVITYTVTGGQKQSHPVLKDAEGNEVEGAAVSEPDGESRTATISGLQPETSYMLFWDKTGNKNLACNVYLTFTTEAVTSPVTEPTQKWITWGTPAATWTGADENGADWYLADSTIALSQNGNIVISYSVSGAQRYAHAHLQGEDGNAVEGAVIDEPDGRERNATISGLEAEKTYRLFWDHTESNGNLECDVYLVFTTAPAAPIGQGDYTVTFDSAGGSDVATQTVNAGELVQEPENKPVRSGFKFIEWQLNGETYDFSTAVNSDLVLTAAWEQAWITFANQTPAVKLWKTEFIDGTETEFYKADDVIELNAAGEAVIHYEVSGQKNYLPARLRDAAGNVIAEDGVVGENGIIIKDSLSDSRTVTISGLASNTEYQLYWPKMQANGNNPHCDVTMVFTTAEFDMDEIRIASGVEEKYTYTGSEIKPVPVVTAGDNTLEPGQDYEVTYSEDCVNIGDKTLTVTGKGAYEGKTVSVGYKITKASIQAEHVSLPEGVGVAEDGTIQYAYTGLEIKPEPVVTVNGRVLVRGTDYVVEYTENADFVNAEEGKVLTLSISARPGSNYKDAVTDLKYTIVPKKITPSVALSQTSYTYSGYLKTPTVTVKDGKTELVKGTDYAVTYASGRRNAGKYKVTVTLQGNYTGSKSVYFTINPKAVTPTVTLSSTSYTYNGAVKKPSVTVKYKTTKLVSGQDYTVSYASGRKNVGKYSVKVTLKGNYSGTKTVYFKINPKKTTISKLTPGKKQITVQWAKQTEKMSTSRITGYQIQYSLTKDFATRKTLTVEGYNKASLVVKSLKSGKRYYVRVRTYKTVKEVKYYSPWSASKYVTVK